MPSVEILRKPKKSLRRFRFGSMEDCFYFSFFIYLLIGLIIFYFLVKPLAKVDYRLANLKIESAQLDRRIVKLEQDLHKARADLLSFSTGSGIERIAREKLNMIYPGEILFTCRDSQGGQDYLIFDEEIYLFLFLLLKNFLYL